MMGYGPGGNCESQSRPRDARTCSVELQPVVREATGNGKWNKSALDGSSSLDRHCSFRLSSADLIRNETIGANADQFAVSFEYVLLALKSSKHVRPLVHTDKELQFVPEKEAPGVERYREELAKQISGLPADSVPHQALIDRLNEAGKTFHVLVLKTQMTIPYTSVFLQLDCQYWSAESEARLRKAMQ